MGRRNLRIAVFNKKPYDERFLSAANERDAFAITFLEPRLLPRTASLAAGLGAVCAFVNDDLGRKVLEKLASVGVCLIVLRPAGFNVVGPEAAERLGLVVARVPAYSPHAVAERALALTLTLNRPIHRAYDRVREGDFRLVGLLGFDMRGKTVGVVGTGTTG